MAKEKDKGSRDETPKDAVTGEHSTPTKDTGTSAVPADSDAAADKVEDAKDGDVDGDVDGTQTPRGGAKDGVQSPDPVSDPSQRE